MKLNDLVSGAGFGGLELSSLLSEALGNTLDPDRKVAILDDKTEFSYDLFLGFPRYCVPAFGEASGMTDEGWIPVEYKRLETLYRNTYAIGDVTSVETAKAGIFAEWAAQTVTEKLIAEFKGGNLPPDYAGAGTCYIEFGRKMVGRVDVDFLSEVTPTGQFFEPSDVLVREKHHFGASHKEKWFGLKD